MPDFEELSPEETRQYQLFVRFTKRATTYNLRRLQAESAIILSDAISTSFSTDHRNQAQLLMRLSRRKAKAYESLSRNKMAIRWVLYKLHKAFNGIGLDL